MSKRIRTARLRNWMLASFCLLLLLIVSLSLLPEALRAGAEAWLRDHGATHAKIEDIDLNLFSGSLVLVGLHAGDGMQMQRLSMQMQWLPLFNRTVMIRALHLYGGTLLIRQNREGQWQFGDVTVPIDNDPPDSGDATGAAAAEWQVAPLNIDLSDINMELTGHSSGRRLHLSLPLQIMSLQLHTPHDHDTPQLALLLQTGAVNLSATDFNVAYRALRLHGKIDLKLKQPDLAEAVALHDLKLELNALTAHDQQGQQLAAIRRTVIEHAAAAWSKGIDLGLLQCDGVDVAGRWAADTVVALKSMRLEQLHAERDGSVTMGNTVLNHLNINALPGGGSLSMDRLNLSHSRAAADGAISVGAAAIKGVHATAVPDAHGEVAIQSITASALQRHASGALKLGAVSAKNVMAKPVDAFGDRFTLGQLQAEKVDVGADEQLQLAALQLSDIRLDRANNNKRANSVTLTAADTLKLTNLQITSANRGGFDQLSIEGLMLPQSATHALGRAGRVLVEQAGMQGNDYHLKRVRLSDLTMQIARQKSGKLAAIDDLATPASSVTANKPAQPEKSSGNKPTSTRLRIDELSVSKGSRIHLHDAAIFPALDTDLVVDRFRLTPLDLSGRSKSNLDAQLQIGHGGSVHAQGRLRAAKRWSTQLEVNLKQLTLPPLSGYIEPGVGRSIRTGQLDMESKIAIADGQIDSNHHLLLRSLTLGASKQPGQPRAGVSMPLDMSLGMLRNDRGDIELDVPVKGALDDPDINISNIINTALLSSLSSGAMTYAALALQPYGTIIVAASVAKDLIGEAARPKLTPMIFESGSTLLTPDMRAYAAKIAALMKQKGLRVQLCGIATGNERSIAAPSAPELNPPPAAALLDDQALLKLASARAEHLSQAIRLHGVDSNQLFVCRPQIDEQGSDTHPRVEMVLN